ncbi:hypothetical protein Tco_1183681 [Tanacetum coccineum]
MDEMECIIKQKWVKGPNTHPQLLHYLILNQSLFHHYLNPKRLKNLGKPKGPLRYLSLVDLFTLLHIRLYETVIKEWEDIIERAATTASSLVAEQDSGNINRTQSMATLNESFPQGTDLGSGPRCQDTILGVQKLKLVNAVRLNLLLPVLVYAARNTLTAVRH